jgi:hypothetical protein
MKEISDHSLIYIDLALRMQANPSLTYYYLEERDYVSNIIRVITEQSKKLPAKEKYEKNKEELIFSIQEILNQPLLDIEDVNRDLSSVVVANWYARA